ncbi:PhnB protein [Salana multivorans]|uniref:PhnB protein n=1 Tax=Salana multivorans TaxID=120377 RepID=A0A3N2D7Y9_9MICO|nr:VOC family protein [Salana multivorans]ROR95574.1 PhnB protein [Salana multivorans]
MTIAVAPYLQFRSNAREAMTYYRSVLGGEVGFSTFGEFGMTEDPAEADQVMHSQIVKDGVAVLMGADTPASMELPERSSIAVSLFGGAEDAEEMHRQWALLSDGAQAILEDLTKAPWGDEFGMLLDRYGTFWMVNIGSAQ